MRLVGLEAEDVLGGCNAINSDYSLAAILRAIIINRSEYTIDSLVKDSVVLLHRADSDSGVKAAMTADSYKIVVVESRNGYFPNDLEVEEWKALDGAPYPISKYLSQFTKTRVFVNESSKRVVAVVDKIATRRWIQAFISTLPRILTWYFTSGLSEEEQAFFKTISVDNKAVSSEAAENAFVEYVNGAAEKIDFRAMSLHKHLDGFAKTVKETQMSHYRRNIQNAYDSINSYQCELATLYSRLGEEQRLLNALEASPEEDNTELFDFFNSHKCLQIKRVNKGDITFGITETLEFYDEEEFVSVYNRKGSYIHSRVDSKDVPTVMHAIFAEHKGVFVTNAVFKLSGMRHISMERDLSREDVLPHPHIYFYGCAGGNDQYYSKYAESGEWQLAIEQAICATKNLNFGDSTVVGRMIQWLDDNKNAPCIKLAEDGRMVSVKEFLKIIKEGEKSNG